jgi:probable nitrogen fixation protein
MTLTLEQNPADVAALATPFLKSLVSIIRATDSYGTWDKKSDASLLAEFIVTKEQRKLIPIIADPDPDIVGRVEQFYAAVGLGFEAETGLMASPMLKLTHEGFGRLLMTTGRLVLLSKTLRDIHRFGFESLSALADAGGKAISDAAAVAATYPEVARA